MQRRTVDRAGALMPALTPPTRHRAGSAANRLKAGAPSEGSTDQSALPYRPLLAEPASVDLVRIASIRAGGDRDGTRCHAARNPHRLLSAAGAQL